MSVQSPAPDCVTADVLGIGKPVVADVVAEDTEATAGTGPRQVLVVERNGSRYRIDAADADPC